MDEAFLNILRCPITRQTLRIVDALFLDRVNSAIEKGDLKTHAGDVVETQLEAALINQDQSFLYGVTDHIPALTPDRAIVLDQFEKTDG